MQSEKKRIVVDLKAWTRLQNFCDRQEIKIEDFVRSIVENYVYSGGCLS